MRKALSVFNRHALFALPILIFLGASIAGLVGTQYGFHNLFRDHPGEFCKAAISAKVCPAFWETAWWQLPFKDLAGQLLGPALFTSANCQNGGFGAALMGLIWTIFILTYHLEDDSPERPSVTHPIRRVNNVIWPGVILLTLVFVLVPSQLAIASSLASTDFDGRRLGFHLWGLFQSLAGMAFALIIVWAVIWASIRLSLYVRYPQLVTLTVISLLVVALFWFVLPLMPGFAVFLFLGTTTLIYGMWLFVPRWAQFSVVGAIAAVVGWCQGTAYKHQFAALESYYQSATNNPALGLPAPKSAFATPLPGADAILTKPADALQKWLTYFQSRHGPKKPILTLVAASGGGYRATYWTALVLDRLGAKGSVGPAVSDSVALFTGASGGMVAASYFVAGENPETARARKGGLIATIDRDVNSERSGPLSFDDRFRTVRRDSLTPVVKKWLRHDLPGALWPWPYRTDRGTELESQWPTLGKTTFASLLEGEALGWRPAIIYSPLLIESGRPLLISNLDLAEISKSDSRAVEFFRRFPDVQGTLTLATAARMSASFPYLTPATELPTNPSERVVDAGYYDNDGIGLATALLRIPDVTHWIKDNTSGVLLLRVNAFAPQSIRGEEFANCESPPVLATGLFESFRAHALRSLRWATSPLEGAYAARSTASRFANGQHVSALKDLFGTKFLAAEIAYHGHASESWLLTEAELSDMRRDLERCNAAEFAKIDAFWSAAVP